jgi:hypothetical protein
MSGVFQNIDPAPLTRVTARRVCSVLCSVYPPPPTFGAGEDTLAGRRGGGGVNILEDARHCSVLHIRKYFVPVPVNCIQLSSKSTLVRKSLRTCYIIAQTGWWWVCPRGTAEPDGAAPPFSSTST